MPNSMVLKRMLSGVCESRNFKIEAVEPELHVSQLSAMELDILENMVW